MNWSLITKTAIRDSRKDRSKLLLFMSSIILGVAALVAINSFNDNLLRDIDNQSNHRSISLANKLQRPISSNQEVWSITKTTTK